MKQGRTLRLAVVLGSVAALSVMGMGLAAAEQTSVTDPGTSEFVVPENVCNVTVDAYGAQGGDTEQSIFIFSNEGFGGLGGRAQGRLIVTPGERLGVNVGGAGADRTGFVNQIGADGGFNGGADGGSGFGQGGGGGGGATDVRQAAGGSGCVPECVVATPPATAGSTPEERMIVAGGGGGAGGSALFSDGPDGGAGGGASGGTPDGDGEDQDFGDGGEAGQPTAGGQGGTSLFGDGDDGTVTGEGGEGGDSLVDGGGGGGGGYTGGGGGGGGEGGGGGGSSYVAPTVADAAVTPGVQEGDGTLILTYDPEAPVACVVVATSRYTG